MNCPHCHKPIEEQKPLIFDSGDQKSANQRTAIIEALKQARSRGCSSDDLNQICFRYSARIFELRRMGWDIRTMPEGRTSRFVLAPSCW